MGFEHKTLVTGLRLFLRIFLPTSLVDFWQISFRTLVVQSARLEDVVHLTLIELLEISTVLLG